MRTFLKVVPYILVILGTVLLGAWVTRPTESGRDGYIVVALALYLASFVLGFFVFPVRFRGAYWPSYAILGGLIERGIIGLITLVVLLVAFLVAGGVAQWIFRGGNVDFTGLGVLAVAASVGVSLLILINDFWKVGDYSVFFAWANPLYKEDED